MKDEYIVMKVSDLRLLLNDIKRFKHYYIYASDQNRDGQGEWHCDIEVGDEPLGEDGWGDGEEHHSFDSLENHIEKFGQTSLSSPASTPAQPANLRERLELCEDMFDDFVREAQQLIDGMRGEEDE